MLTRDALRSLAVAQPKRPVASVFVRSDPRDPANTASAPAWHTALRNGLASVTGQLESGEDREDRLAFRQLRTRIEEELVAMGPEERARSVAWFLGVDGELSERFALQLPLRADAVIWDGKPFISPLVDIADRGAPVGVMLVSGDVVRLLQIAQAEVSEPPHSCYELELGDWRQFGGTAGGSPARGVHVTSHRERYEARVDAQRERLFHTAASETAKRLDELRWEHVVLVCEVEVAARFRARLPSHLSDRVALEIDRNLAAEGAQEVADALEPEIERAWFERTTAQAEEAYSRAKNGRAATSGATETLGALVEGRVERLILDTAYDFSDAEVAPSPIGGPPELLGERAVEAAIATDAQVTALSASDSPTLREAGGMVALLRY
jgi:hypothetical protein